MKKSIDYVANSNLVLKDSGKRESYGTGAVRDCAEQKGRFDLMPPISEFLVSRIYEDGAIKYAARNWEHGIPVARMIESAIRHLAKYRGGMRDEPHLSMAAWNILGALHMAAMVEMGRMPASLFDLPNHFGDPTTFSALSPHEIKSLKQFLGIKDGEPLSSIREITTNGVTNDRLQHSLNRTASEQLIDEQVEKYYSYYHDQAQSNPNEG